MAAPHKCCWVPPVDGRSGRWRFTATVNGKRKYFTVPSTIGERQKKAAEDWMIAKLASLKTEPPKERTPKLRTIYREWIEWGRGEVAADRLSELTVEGNRKHASNGLDAIEDLGLDNLSNPIAKPLEDHWKTLSPTTIRNRLAALRVMFRWAVEHGRLPRNPLDGVAGPKPEYQGDRYASEGEVSAFAEFVDRWAAAEDGKLSRFAAMTATLVKVVIETGCRPGEMCKAQWEHWKLEDRVIVLPPKSHKTGRRVNKPRFVLVSEEIAREIEAIRSHPDRHPEWIFTHRVGPRAGTSATAEDKRWGTPWNSNALSRRVKDLRRAAIKAGVPLADTGVKRLHLYRLRHSSITQQLADGLTTREVADLHGTSERVIESTYLHPQIEHLRAALDRRRSR